VTPLRVLLVTGAYYPEISSSGVQARDLARALGGRVRFTVVTTAVDPSLPSSEVIDGVAVHRIAIDVRRRISRLAASAALVTFFVGARRTIDLLHVHGFSSKNILLALLARLFRKPLILSLHTAGQDDPASVRARGRIAFWAYRCADRFLSVSPHLSDQFRRSGLSQGKLIDAPNGVDVDRFHPVAAQEQASIRRALALPSDAVVILFVGFFSRDKRPGLLFDAWMRVANRLEQPVALVCVGATRSAYFEVDPAIAERMREQADRAGLGSRLLLVEPTNAIERYFQSADIFALPSAREAMPMALLEAMACGLPCVAWRLPRVTDAIVDDGVSGLLVESVDELADTLESLVAHPSRAREIGRLARERIVERFAIDRTAERWLAAYSDVLEARR
jgi:glycosyltransferase involved in cell wall biosynthesis